MDRRLLERTVEFAKGTFQAFDVLDPACKARVDCGKKAGTIREGSYGPVDQRITLRVKKTIAAKAGKKWPKPAAFPESIGLAAEDAAPIETTSEDKKCVYAPTKDIFGF